MLQKLRRAFVVWAFAGSVVAALGGIAGGAAVSTPASWPAEEVTVTAYYGGRAKMTQERTVRFQAGDTAMSATLRALRAETNPERTFVKSIEGVANDDAAKEYWLYFVNGEAMHVGATETRLKSGDRVLWFLRRQSSTSHEKAESRK